MPKFSKTFGRRKSTANQYEEDSPVVEHSFKVFERPDRGGNSFDGGVKFAKVATSPGRLHVDDDNMFEHIGTNRGSGASNTNTASTTDNSSRLSATSTTPSSTDVHNDWKSPHDKPFSDIPLPPLPRSAPGFSLKNAGRAMSWGRHKTPPFSRELQSPMVKNSIEDEEPSGRARTVTGSSYASTATPPKLGDENLGLSLGGDFSEMFAGFGKRDSVILEQETARAMSQSPDTLPTGPATRSYNSTRSNNLSPINVDKSKEVEASPYSWGSQHSREGLMSSVSPPLPVSKDKPPPVPKHGAPRTNTASPASYARPQKAGGAVDNGLKRSSGVGPRRQSTSEYRDSMDEDARLLRESVTASRKMNEPTYNHKVRDSWALPPTSSYKVDDSTLASWGTGSVQTTPRAKMAEPSYNEENIFDNQITASATIAMRYEDKVQTPPLANGPQPKVMTPAQFERYKQDQERLRSLGGRPTDDGEEEEDETYDDDEDDAEKAKQLAKQRRKQEAHMAVYRQQMMKVTGEAPGSSARPSMFVSQSTPNLASLGKAEDNEEEDEEVPLAILQAHGFPSKTKPPMKSMGSNPNLRSGVGSTASGVVDPRLPVFARNLPQDPYYGAGLVNPMHRESLAFGGGTPSINGGVSRGLPPGGLVGVIATEERSRAMRRGSPNPQGEYGPSPSNGFSGMGLPPSVHVSGSGGSMYNGVVGNPMGPYGGMAPPMITPGDQAQIQMTQQMQQFMQMQMQFMQMMTTPGQQQAPMGHMSHQSLQIPRPGSVQGLSPGGAHQRSLTMMEPNAAPWNQQRSSTWAPSVYGGNGGYAPSIAPSERSNIGLPGRYRPVSQAPAPDHKSRTSTMSGALQGWDSKNGATTIKSVKKSGNVTDEDEEEGWEEMAKKRAEKKSLWRAKKDKDSNGLKEMLGLSH